MRYSEASYAPFVKLELQPTPWMRLVGGLRADTSPLMCVIVVTTCPEQPAGRQELGPSIVPKVNLILGPWFNTEFFVNYGEGYHSNDARSASRGRSPLARAKST